MICLHMVLFKLLFVLLNLTNCFIKVSSALVHPPYMATSTNSTKYIPGNNRNEIALEMNLEADLSDARKGPHRENDVKHLLKKFERHCQNINKYMDRQCANRLQKIAHYMMTEMDIDYGQSRMSSSKMLCVKREPISMQWYDPSKQLCCNGLHGKSTGDEMCCGNNIYNPLSSDVGEIYNETQNLCCNGVLYNRTSASMKCCGKYVYDITTSTECCGDQLFNPKRKFCCANLTLHHNIGRNNSHGGCCGTEKYDDRCYSCNKTKSKAIVYPKFNMETERCCHGRIKIIKKNRRTCCGKQLIDKTVERCIDNNIVVKQYRMLYTRSSSSRHTPYSELVSIMNSTEPETNFKEENAVTIEASHNQKWSTILIIFTGVFIIGVLAVVYKRRKHICKRKETLAMDIDLNNTSGLPVNGSLGYEENSCEGPCESGYQSLQQPSSYNSQVTLDDSEVDRADPGLRVRAETSGTKENTINTVNVSEDLASMTDKSANLNVHFEKLVQHSDVNVTAELCANTGTQTFPIKETNRRDIFGRPFQISCYLDKFNRTVQWNESDSKMSLPLSALNLHSIQVQASSFHDIPAIYEKFCFSKDTRLASPVVEYCLTGCKNMSEHALVELPIINDGKLSLEIIKFRSDEGLNQLSDVEHIPILKEESKDVETFCIIRQDKALIYTQSFSGFCCVAHGQRDSISMNAFLFGSYKKVMDNKEVRLALYIADELHKFKDYNQRMFDNEKMEGREKKTEKLLKLPDCCLNGDDCLEITAAIVGDVGDMWEHKLHPRENRPIENEVKIVKLKNLSRCCQSENALPYQFDWYLINKTQARPSNVVQCLVDVNCTVSEDRAESTHTSLVIDELQLRARDRSEVSTITKPIVSFPQ